MTDQPRRGRGRGHGGAPAGPGFGPGYGPAFGPGFDARGGGRGHGGRGRGPRPRRGDVRLAVLRLLSEEPMHGYQIITELGERSGGVWRPSPGSIYPTLQVLADEGLVTSAESDGRRVFSLTDSGRVAVTEAESHGRRAPWDELADDADRGAMQLRDRLGSGHGRQRPGRPDRHPRADRPCRGDPHGHAQGALPPAGRGRRVPDRGNGAGRRLTYGLSGPRGLTSKGQPRERRTLTGAPLLARR